MGTTLNKETQTKLLQENIVWLKKQDRTLERDHTIVVLEDQINCIADDSWGIQLKQVACLRQELNFYKAQLHTYIEEIIKAQKGLRRLTKKNKILKEKYRVDELTRAKLLIYLKNLMDASKPYLNRKKMTPRHECDQLNMSYDSCAKLRHEIMSRSKVQEPTLADDNVRKARAIVAERKQHWHDEEVARKMLSRWRTMWKEHPGKPRPDVENMLGILDVVRKHDTLDVPGPLK